MSDAGSFYKSCLAFGQCREVSYDSYHGLAFAQLDARFSKTISIKDRYNVALFFQGFNLTNRANYGPNYDGNVSNASSSFLTPLGFINPTTTVIPRSFTGEFGGGSPSKSDAAKRRPGLRRAFSFRDQACLMRFGGSGWRGSGRVTGLCSLPGRN